jgi:hypothetical protein
MINYELKKSEFMSDDKKPFKLNNSVKSDKDKKVTSDESESNKIDSNAVEEHNLVPDIFIFGKIKSFIKEDMEKNYPFTVIFSSIVGLVIFIMGIVLSLGTSETIVDNVAFHENGMFDALIAIIGFLLLALSLYHLFIKKSGLGLNLDSLKDLDSTKEDIKTSENFGVEKSKDKNDIEKIDIPIIKKDISFKNDETDNNDNQ